MAIVNNPYPLLDNEKGSFDNNHFDVEIKECSVNDGVYHFQFNADINEEIIKNLIDQNAASFAVKVENKPFFFKIFKAELTNPYEITIDINFESVSSDFSFEFTPLILTNYEFEYININANSPMCNYTFQLDSNQIIGSHSSIKLSFERAYRKISSGPLIKVVKLPPRAKPNAGTMDIDLNDEYCIRVKLSEDTHNKFMILNKNEPKLLDALITFPVLQHTLSELLMNQDLREKSWAKLLDNEYDIFELKDQEGVLKKCDEILQRSIPSFIDYFENKFSSKVNNQKWIQ